ncbi:MAG TPA: DUF3826 domain-containing protein [Chitinophagaceae bacterium]|jgi:23S rRNA C2498 (ribose-2'-O)-methylase RlmM|nr:DUF3826 domain-containing protein [Chitinophagaceae bacterium]HRG91290.1 DUF3826 domain-containing protein [Chitinophagaceae bacterium]
MKKHLLLKGDNNGLFLQHALLFFMITAVLFLTTGLQAQTTEDKEAAFKKTLWDRSAKIVTGLNIAKANKKEKITQLIAGQYYELNKVHDLTISTEEKASRLEALHRKFTKKLDQKLSDNQVEQVKNGMTYNVLNVTYTAYQDMILTLTAAQKEKIYNWLLEAREKAMMEGSSDAKHKMFGKYKGKINNYLSEQGYNMKAEEKAWQQRLREKREKDAAGKQNAA